MNGAGVGQAPGKLLLFGEHAVVYGHPALGLSLDRGVEVQLERGEGAVEVHPKLPISIHAAQPEALAEKALGDASHKLNCKVELGLPPMAGFGSSAALAVALVRAKAALDGRSTPDFRRTLDAAVKIEAVAHGKASGVDPAIVARGGLVYFQKRDKGPPLVRRLRPGMSLSLVVGAAGQHGGTGRVVAHMAALRRRSKPLVEAAMDTLGACARAGSRAIQRAELDELTEALNLAQGVLDGLGLVHEPVREAIARCREAGALAAKMSGAGGEGGAFFGLFAERAAAERAIEGLSKIGLSAWCEELSAGAA